MEEYIKMGQNKDKQPWGTTTYVEEATATCSVPRVYISRDQKIRQAPQYFTAKRDKRHYADSKV